MRRRAEGKAVYQHMYDSNHAMDWNRAKMVFKNSNEKQRLVVESCLIQHLPTLDLLPGASSVTKAIKDLILEHNIHILADIPHTLGNIT